MIVHGIRTSPAPKPLTAKRDLSVGNALRCASRLTHFKSTIHTDHVKVIEAARSLIPASEFTDPNNMGDDVKIRRETFLRVAASASWFNNTFDYRAVCRWCSISETEGSLIVQELIDSGLVRVDARGLTHLTGNGQRQVQKAA